VRVNSDGNLTFGQPDAGSTERDLARFSSGPPRIAALFADLDPSRGAVRIRRESDGIVIVWDAVPSFEGSNSNSFSIKLFKETGAIELVYSGRVDVPTAVVGISPGGLLGEINAVDFSTDLPTASLAGAIVEVFSDEMEFSESALAKKFFQSHPDAFDHLIVFLAFDYRLFGGAFAYELNVRNEVSGIGLLQLDNALRFGSQGRLRSFVLMGALDGPGRYPEDPRQIFLGTNSTLSILGQETGHRWLAFTPFRDGEASSRTILGRQSAHWSFYFDSDASVMEGNDIEDRGPERGNQRFLTVGATSTYSGLDRYIMGLVGKEAVPPSFVVENPSGARPAEANPALGVTFGGSRREVRVTDVIAANGARTPPVLQSSKVFRQAFILLARRGRKPTDAQVAKVQRIRDAWVEFFNSATGGEGWVVTDLQNGPGTTATSLYFPHVRNDARRYTGLALANWGARPADVQLSYRDSAGARLYGPSVSVNPRMITLPPGRQVALTAEEIHGLGAGSPAGWIRADSTSDRVSGYFLDGDRAGARLLDGAAAATTLSETLYFTRARPGGGVLGAPDARVVLELVNPGTAGAAVTLDWIDESGRTAASTEATVPAGGRLETELGTLFAEAPLLRPGYVRARSNHPLAGYHSFEAESAVGALSAQPAGEGTRLYAAQFVSGAASGLSRWFTDVSLINTTGVERTVELRLAGRESSEAADPPSLTLRIPPRGQVRRRGDLLFGLADPTVSGRLVERTLVVTADGPGIAGDVVFGDAAGGRFLAALPLGPAGARQLFPHLAQGSAGGGGAAYFTGVALHNPNDVPTTALLELFSARGEAAGSTRIPLAPGARVARTLPELLPGLGDQLGGYAVVTSSGLPIVGAALVGDQALEFLAAVAPQVIP
jgi:hypothetical protein